MYDKTSKESILEYALQLKGKTFGEIDRFNRLSNENNKGKLGHIVEESYFGYEINSDANPDFSVAGIELKVTPFKINKNKTISAKERLVLNVIDYNEEYKFDFYNSSFWKKNKSLLIVFYEWKPDLDKKDYVIEDVILYEFSEDDLVTIKSDWEIIINKIKEGKAHEISESDTNYLSACTKGRDRHSVRTQPFSTQCAKQRAFSLKSGYMTQLLRKHFGQVKKNEVSLLEGTKKTINQVLLERFMPYYQKSIDEIAKLLNIDIYTKSGSLVKNHAQMLTSAILGLKGNDINNIEEFSKANIKFKTVRIEKDASIKQHMSFKNFKYAEIIKEEWEDSQLRNMFEEQKYLFVVFKFDSNNVLRLDKIKLWNMPLSILDTKLKEVWEETVRVIKEGIVITEKGNKKYDNLPGSTFNNICHVRPHAKDSQDTYPLPQGGEHIKKCFWLDRRYIKSIVE
ncbi:Sau3AI family type II restriction endonuclease [Intestinibacter bartlettii]|uniref:Sau3AI family type II restriction endonuclease n=1 Tax=Intestinibacter bartlettii TaxID=261299 RepID=UPI0006C53B55|nr:Sau3AI family type II restriction endonuclease [Intestinibacter bartlettii]CUP15172.1 DNA mismatch repair protein MutH [Intestinibacter bartlettii]